MTPARAVLVGLVAKYLAGFMDPSISLLDVHKLMYFAQEAGEPLHIKYVKAPYGPYAENLQHILTTFEGYLISGANDTCDKSFELAHGAADDAQEFLKGHPATLARFERVSKLIEGFESSFGMELLSTVHWVAKHEGAKDEASITRAVHAWGPTKLVFTERQTHITVRHLSNEGWLPDLGDAGSCAQV